MYDVYIYIYIYMCVCVCVCVYIQIYTHTHMFIYIYIYTHTHTNTNVYVCVCVCVCVSVCVCVKKIEVLDFRELRLGNFDEVVFVGKMLKVHRNVLFTRTCKFYCKQFPIEISTNLAVIISRV